MRFPILAALLMIATTSCEPGASPYRLKLGAVPSAVASVNDERNLGVSASAPRACGLAFELASVAEADSFLIEARGLWRDHLSGAVADAVTGEFTQPGFEISSGRISSVQVFVAPAPSETEAESSADGFSATGRSEPRLASGVSIGPMLDDGFRIVQLDYSAAADLACETFALKVDRLGDGRAVLLVRGPLNPLDTRGSARAMVH